MRPQPVEIAGMVRCLPPNSSATPPPPGTQQSSSNVDFLGWGAGGRNHICWENSENLRFKKSKVLEDRCRFLKEFDFVQRKRVICLSHQFPSPYTHGVWRAVSLTQPHFPSHYCDSIYTCYSATPATLRSDELKMSTDRMKNILYWKATTMNIRW